MLGLYLQYLIKSTITDLNKENFTFSCSVNVGEFYEYKENIKVSSALSDFITLYNHPRGSVIHGYTSRDQVRIECLYKHIFQNIYKSCRSIRKKIKVSTAFSDLIPLYNHPGGSVLHGYASNYTDQVLNIVPIIISKFFQMFIRVLGVQGIDQHK